MSRDAQMQSEVYLLAVLRIHETNQLLRVLLRNSWDGGCAMPHTPAAHSRTLHIRIQQVTSLP